VLAARKIDDAVGSCPASLGLDLGRLFDGSSGSIHKYNIVNPIGHYGSAALACPEKSGQDRPVNDSVVPSSYHSTVSPSGYPGRFHPDAAPRDAIPKLAPGAALIVALLLSVGLWSVIWLAVSALAAMWPW
jgi:hypothetical protein